MAHKLGNQKCQSLAEKIERIQEENKHQRSCLRVTNQQRQAIADALLNVGLNSFEGLMREAYGKDFFALNTEPEYLAEGVEISPSMNVAFGVLGTKAVGKNTSMDQKGITYRASRNAILAINKARYCEPAVFTVDIDGELVVVT